MMLDDITLYWLTNSSIGRTQQLQCRGAEDSGDFGPVSVTVFPGEIYRAPRSWAERSYHNLTNYHAVDKGGHFAAWEQPQLFSEDIRAAFKSLR